MSRHLPFAIALTTLAAASFAALGLHAKPTKKAGPEEREARAFLETVTGVLQPLRTVANQAAWLASTDVQPEHTAARTAAEKALAAVSGAKVVIDKTRALLAQKSALDSRTVRQLEKLLLAAADSPATIPEVV